MTLIASGIHRYQAFLAIDSRLSAGGKPIEEDAIKCAHISCSEGKILIGFTGEAEIINKGTIDWILDQLSNTNLKRMTASDALDFLGVKLTEHWQQTFYSHNAPALIITASGWTDERSRHPKLLSLANCLDNEGSYEGRGELEFNIVNYPIPSHGSSLIVLGDLRATNGKSYKEVKKKVIKLLNKNTNALDEKTLDEMMTLIVEGSRNPDTNSVNNRVKGTRMDRRKEGIIYKAIPEETSYSLPGFSNPTMTVSGISIKNDFVEGGTTIIGSSSRLESR